MTRLVAALFGVLVAATFAAFFVAQEVKNQPSVIQDVKVETGGPDAEAIRKMRGILKEAKAGRTSFSAEELALIEEWVPPSLGKDQIAEALAQVAEAIKGAPKEGMAMGIAMKALAGRPADSDDVKEVVAALRA